VSCRVVSCRVVSCRVVSCPPFANKSLVHECAELVPIPRPAISSWNCHVLIPHVLIHLGGCGCAVVRGCAAVRGCTAVHVNACKTPVAPLVVSTTLFLRWRPPGIYSATSGVPMVPGDERDQWGAALLRESEGASSDPTSPYATTKSAMVGMERTWRSAGGSSDPASGCVCCCPAGRTVPVVSITV
jgi:hypothetical protein